MSAEPESDNVKFVRAYFAAVEAGAVGEELAAYLHPDLVQREFPNKIVVHGATRSLKDVLGAAERGQKVIKDQKYAISSVIEQGNRLAIECEWTGTLQIAVPAWKVEAGYTLKAYVATIIELKDGRVFRQQNYDCYEPFA